MLTAGRHRPGAFDAQKVVAVVERLLDDCTARDAWTDTRLHVRYATVSPSRMATLSALSGKP
jgi:hypothetical protein